MLSIRLQRIGKKHQPSYRLVVAERRSKLGAPPAEDLGFYNPFTKAASFNQERVLYWIKNGARASATVHNLLVRTGIIQGVKVRIPIRIKKSEPATAATPKVEASVSETAAEAPAEASAETVVQGTIEPQAATP